VKQIFTFIILLVFIGCHSAKEEQSNEDSKFVYDMYEPSEMANLMNAMYDYNLTIKKKILNGEVPQDFPLEFMKIHSADLSDFKYRNETFEAFSTLFINAEKEVFNQDATQSIEERFNNAVGICISCHQTEFTGPIPRIKKILIQ
jgi:cytochrome c553